jgi:hypothetical protein
MHIFTIQKNLENILPHLADGPDLALHDFFLFDCLMEKLQEIVLRNREDLISEIRQLFDEIDKETVMALSLGSKGSAE